MRDRDKRTWKFMDLLVPCSTKQQGSCFEQVEGKNPHLRVSLGYTCATADTHMKFCLVDFYFVLFHYSFSAYIHLIALLFLFNLEVGCLLACFVCCCSEKVSNSLDSLQYHYVAKADLELLIFLGS